MWGYETGIKYSPAHNLTMRGSVYMNEGHDLIQVSAGKFSNTGDFLFRGAQADAAYALTDEISLTAAYTFLDPGTRTQGRPAHTATGGARFGNATWGITADALYVGKYYAADNSQSPINDFFTLNARGWYNFTEQIQVYLGVNNLLDRRHVIYASNTSTSGLFQMPGVMGNVGVKYTF